MSPPFGGATSAVIINSPGVVQAVRKRFIVICEGRRKKEEGRRKREEGRRKREVQQLAISGI
ncbi:hypothetical protein IQ269_19425 [Tychonema sp. LEGE 07199]|uniref:hypothetical protein n=1 Tax=unclassified Tychonema TaxID=2642144 RepID=UPI001881C08A|nr:MULTISPECIES: hypothetical protein [unclassified Tychonema]MBE9122910.1 hypothetical protein [Tychonema sp. LEGE 07199]MBE9134756.1 hypothetical protein [Tychonema sp. LEGE 07196]